MKLPVDAKWAAAIVVRAGYDAELREAGAEFQAAYLLKSGVRLIVFTLLVDGWRHTAVVWFNNQFIGLAYGESLMHAVWVAQSVQDMPATIYPNGRTDDMRHQQTRRDMGMLRHLARRLGGSIPYDR